MKPQIYKVCALGSGWLSAMAKPVAGEWIDDEFAAIADAGIKKVVSLLEPHEAYELGLEDEETICERHGMQFGNFPVADRSIPDSAHGFVSFIRQIHADIASGVDTVVHCRAGIGRSGLVAAAVLVRAGHSPEAAFDLVSRARGIAVPDTEGQRNWLIGQTSDSGPG